MFNTLLSWLQIGKRVILNNCKSIWSFALMKGDTEKLEKIKASVLHIFGKLALKG